MRQNCPPVRAAATALLSVAALPATTSCTEPFATTGGGADAGAPDATNVFIPAPGAGEDAGASGAAADGSATAEACVDGGCEGACVPGPVTGPPSMRCAGQAVQTCGVDGQWGTVGVCDAGCCAAACVNLGNDVANCGACAHDCLGGGCTGGMCLPLTLATAPWIVNGIAVDAAHVYWTAGDAVWEGPVGGGPATPIVSGRTAPGAITVDATGVYWVDQGSGSSGGPAVMRAPLDGGAPGTLAGAATNGAIAVDGTSAFWITGPTAPALVEAPLAGIAEGGAPVTLASSPLPMLVFAIDESAAYVPVASCDGGCTWSVAQVPLDGLPEGGAPVILASGQGDVAAMAVGPGSLYWTTYPRKTRPDAGGGSGGTVVSVALDGAAPVTLATGQQTTGGLAFDATHLYWSTVAGISSAALDGGAAQVIYATTPDAPPVGLVQSGLALYWVSTIFAADGGASSTIVRMAKP